MAVTLLEMLLDAGMLTRQQLDDALQHRVFYGGKIGTNLVELGYLREEVLAKFLSRKLAVPYVPPEKLLSIPAETIALLPRELALKYKAIPLSLEKKRLNLVMADPSDLAAIDNIAFITGYVVKPLITPELRLVQALGQYYQMEIGPRYRKLIERLATEPPAAEPEPVAAPSEPPSPPPAPTRPAPPPTEPAQTRPRPAGDGSPEEGDEQPLASRVHAFSPDAVAHALARVEDREEIATALLGLLGDRFPCAALFVVRNETATGWRAFRNNRELGNFEQLHLPFSQPSVLKTVTEGKGFYLGPIADTPLNRQLLKALRGNGRGSVLVMPVVVLGRVVGLLYLEAGGQDLSQRVSEIQRLLMKAALAFELLVCREKILLI